MQAVGIGVRFLFVAALSGAAAAQQATLRAPRAALPPAAKGVAVTPVVSTAVAPFHNFESGPVRPLALSPDGTRLYALNTPDARLEVFATGVDAQGVPHLSPLGSVFTGLEPVSLALDPSDPDTVFVANLLSDTVAVVDVAHLALRAVVPVGDEPQDLVVVGDKVFVATSRSSSGGDALVPGPFVDNAIVVLQRLPPWAVLSRTEVPGHKPRALAVADGRVFGVPLDSGNHTTVVDADQADTLNLDQIDVDAFDPPFVVNPTLLANQFKQIGFLNQNFGVFGWAVPTTGRIVMDSEFPALVPQLADQDTFALDAAGSLLAGGAHGVGTTLLAIERNPATGALWIAGTDARNRTRFEPSVAGAGFDNRITIVQPDAAGGGAAVAQIISLEPPTTLVAHAQPVALAFLDGPAGRFGYVATLGDDAVVALDAVTARPVAEFSVGRQPAGLATDSARGLLYVLSRGDKTLRAYSAAAGHAPIGRVARLAYDPEPQAVALGRKHLYDARASGGAGNGNMSCASCHVFGHMDQLAWDLGNPRGGLGVFYTDLMTGDLGFGGNKIALKSSLMTHPMKGPMTTQSLRGLLAEGAQPLHWRGDRRFLQMFRGAFSGLLGGSGLTPTQMQEFTAFVRTLSWPGNPFQPKDRQYVGTAAHGRDLFGMNPNVAGKPYNPNAPGLTCIDCHKGAFAAGNDFTGSQPTVNFDGESQLFNTAQLRGAYEKDFAHLTGFGTLHDGSLDGIEEFLHFVPQAGMQAFPSLTEPEKQAVEDFCRAWDSGTAPLVGDQLFADAGTPAAQLDAWLGLAQAQAGLPQPAVDLVGRARGLSPLGDGPVFGLLFADGAWTTDTARVLPDAALRAALAAGTAECTFTCVPPGTGARLGLDRDEDGLYDGIEAQHGTNSADPDTDHDGYADGLELVLGSNAAVFDVFVPDATAPVVLSAEALDVFTDAATLHAVTDEPATLKVDVGLAAGSYDLLSFADTSLRRAHDVVLAGLPAGTPLFFRVTAADRNGNQGTSTGELLTAPPLYHVEAITLDKSGAGPITLTATARVVDHLGEPVVDIPVRGVWTGPLGGADFFPFQRTDATGTATFTIGPYAPTASSVSFGVAYLGLNEQTDPFFIGFGGNTPSFFYNQSANLENYETVAVP